MNLLTVLATLSCANINQHLTFTGRCLYYLPSSKGFPINIYLAESGLPFSLHRAEPQLIRINPSVLSQKQFFESFKGVPYYYDPITFQNSTCYHWRNYNNFQGKQFNNTFIDWTFSVYGCIAQFLVRETYPYMCSFDKLNDKNCVIISSNIEGPVNGCVEGKQYDFNCTSTRHFEFVNDNTV